MTNKEHMVKPMKGQKVFVVATMGFCVGVLYYLQMKASIKDVHKNCSFVANKTTDFFGVLGRRCYCVLWVQI